MSRVFCTIFPFVESHDSSLRLGRYVANYEFLKALLNYGTFDEYHLYCLNPAHFQQTVQKLSSDNQISDLGKQRVSLFLFDSLEDNLKNIEYEVMHLGGWGYFFAGAVNLRNRYAKTPFPITGIIHSLNGQETTYHAFKLLKSAHQSFDAIVCTSLAGKEVLKKSFKRLELLDGAPEFIGDYLHIPLAFEDGFNTIPDKDSSRNRLGIDNETFVILYLGRLSPTTKGDLYPLLLALQRVLKSTDKSVQLILAGGVDPNELHLHKEMIAELGLERSVRLMINFNEEDKTSIYSSADVCVAPSDNIQGTFGISIVEAMAAGVPVIAADIDGYKELVRDGETGFKIKTTWTDKFPLSEFDDIMDFPTMQMLLAQNMVIDVPDMAAKILYLLNNEDRIVEMGERSKEIAFENYSWSLVIKMYEKEWRRLKSLALSSKLESVGENLFTNDYLSTFSHYPTQILNENMKLSITERGKELLSTGVFPAFYGNMVLSLNQDIMVKVLKVVENGSAVVNSVYTQFGNEKDINSARNGILWLAKYDLLRIDGEN